MHPKICKNNCKLYFSNDHFWLPPFPHFKHFSLIFMFVLKQNCCLLQYVCFYSLVQDPEHCINKLLMQREFYKLKFSVLFVICAQGPWWVWKIRDFWKWRRGAGPGADSFVSKLCWLFRCKPCPVGEYFKIWFTGPFIQTINNQRSYLWFWN